MIAGLLVALQMQMHPVPVRFVVDERTPRRRAAPGAITKKRPSAKSLKATKPRKTSPVKSGSVKSSLVKTSPVKKTASPKSGPRVVIDAGHGGPDVGGPMMTPNLREKDITLQVALRLGEALRQRGISVVYTRTRDTLIALADRGRIANQANGDLFISIHVNAANPRWKDPSAARGFETYFLAEAKTEDAQRVEEMENESIRFETEKPVAQDDPLGFILSDMKQNEHLRESSDLAEIVQKHLAQVHPGPSRGVKQAGFKVLVTAFMPAVLVEVGFGTNTAEAEFLASASKQKTLAKAIAEGTGEYLERYQRRVGGGASSGAHD